MIMLAVVAALFTGCTMNGGIDKADRNKEFKCINIITNETFQYNSNTITDIRIGSDGSRQLFSMNLVTNKGVKMLLNQDNEKNYNCVKIKGQ